MTKKLFLLYSLIFAGIIFYESCVRPSAANNCYCDSANTLHRRFIASGVKLFNHSSSDTLFQTTTPLGFNETAEIDSIPAKNYVLAFNFEYSQTVCQKPVEWPHLLAAAAADPIPCPDPAGVEKIDSIQLTTLYDYDNLHPAGAIINDLYTVAWGDFSVYNLHHIMRLSDFLQNTNRPIETPTMLARLNRKPDSNRDFQASVRLKLSSGLVVNLTTKKVFLKRN